MMLPAVILILCSVACVVTSTSYGCEEPVYFSFEDEKPERCCSIKCIIKKPGDAYFDGTCQTGGKMCGSQEKAVCGHTTIGTLEYWPKGQCISKSARRLLDAEDYPESNVNPLLNACSQNEDCGQILTEYPYIIGSGDDTLSSRSDFCHENDKCTDEVETLFNDAINTFDLCPCDAACRDCSSLNLYQYINDDEARTYAQAKAYCDANYQGLAPIVTQQEFECASRLITNNAAWIGLQALNVDNGDYTYVDGTQCPIPYNGKYGQCVPSSWWEYKGKGGNHAGRPRCYHNDENGSRCVNLDDYMDNDVDCDDTLLAVLCNV